MARVHDKGAWQGCMARVHDKCVWQMYITIVQGEGTSQRYMARVYISCIWHNNVRSQVHMTRIHGKGTL